MKITLNLWINNQPGDSDQTADYLDAARWSAPAGVVYDPVNQTLRGDPDAVWLAFRSLAAAVARAGHGLDIEDVPPPVLTACPDHMTVAGYTCATESLARLTSSDAKTWAEFVARMEAK